MLTDPSVKFLVRLSTCLIAVASIIVFVTVMNSDPEPLGSPHYEFDQTLRRLISGLGPPLAIGMGVLWFYVGAAWEEAGNLVRGIIALITLPPLPFLLIGAVVLLMYLSIALLFAAIFIAVCFSPSTYRTYCHRDRYWHHHHHHHSDGC